LTVDSATQITATAPAHVVGTVDVTVTTASGTSDTSPADQFTYQAAPSLTTVSPVSGPLTGGTPVTLLGTNFLGASAVMFGSVAVTDFTIALSGTAIFTTAPVHGAGTVDVTVTTPGGTSATSPADHFTYQTAPSVTEVSPLAGPLEGGTSVTVTGTNFLGANVILFGST